MDQAAASFDLRALAKSGITVEQLRAAIRNAPPEAKLVLVQSPDDTLRFPPLCPNCGKPATSTLHLERVFLFYVYRGDDSKNETVPTINTLEVPFCEDCQQQHRSRQIEPSPWTPLLRIISEAEGFAGLVVIAISFLFLQAAIKQFSLIPLLLACLPLSVGYFLIRPVWQKSKHLSLPKPTDIELAIDFTPFVSLEYEPAWRAFQFRSQSYAEAFRLANNNQQWNPHGSEAKSASKKRKQASNKSTWIVGAVLLAFVIYMIWDEGLVNFLSDLF